MTRTALAVVLIAALATSASADVGAEALAELTRKRTHDKRGPVISLHAGYHGDVAGFGELRVGYGAGSFTESLLFPTMRLWRVSAAVRGAYGRDDSVAVSLLGGRSVVSILGWSLEGGVDARVIGDGDLDLGPIVSGALRVGRLGLQVNGWTHVLGDDLDWGFSVGLGVNLGDYTGASDVAKARIKEKAGF